LLNKLMKWLLRTPLLTPQVQFVHKLHSLEV